MDANIYTYLVAHRRVGKMPLLRSHGGPDAARAGLGLLAPQEGLHSHLHTLHQHLPPQLEVLQVECSQQHG
jgi:hypothetical protein